MPLYHLLQQVLIEQELFVAEIVAEGIESGMPLADQFV